MNFQPPEHDFVSKNVHLKGNLLVKSGNKLFIFGDKREMHLLCGYYLKETLVSMSIWPYLEITKSCLIKESNYFSRL